MMLKFYLLSLILLIELGCKKQTSIYVYETDVLKIEQLSESTFRHISFLKTDNFGKVASNGMIVVDANQALIVDTPVDAIASKELIDWLENTLKVIPKAVVVTHFHRDCLGGLNEFHNRQILSYASFRTIDLAQSTTKTLPQIGFDTRLNLTVGNKQLVNQFLGEGHTQDNIISYFPSEGVLFGGCLIKAIGAKKGNLADASVNKWSNTVTNLKAKFYEAKIVIPGHGNPGGQDLLDYTIKLFK